MTLETNFATMIGQNSTLGIVPQTLCAGRHLWDILGIPRTRDSPTLVKCGLDLRHARPQLQGSRTLETQNSSKKTQNILPRPEPKFKKENSRMTQMPKETIIRVFSGSVLYFCAFLRSLFGVGPWIGIIHFFEEFRCSGFWIPVVGRACRNAGSQHTGEQPAPWTRIPWASSTSSDDGLREELRRRTAYSSPSWPAWSGSSCGRLPAIKAEKCPPCSWTLRKYHPPWRQHMVQWKLGCIFFVGVDLALGLSWQCDP